MPARNTHERISRFLSLILRHAPDKIGLALDRNGWADVAELLDKATRHGTPLTLEALRDVVAGNDKQRFAFSEDGLRIRASQGHSLRSVDLALAPAVRIRELTLNSMTTAENAGYVISTLPGIQAAFPDLKYRDFLAPEAMEQLPVLANGCFDVWSAAGGVQDAYQPDALVPGSPWWEAMTAVDDFSPKGTMPFAIFQGSADTTTPPNLTLRERTALCSAGNAVDYHAFEGLDHSAVVPEAASRLPDWFADRFAGKAARNGCAAP